MAYVYLASPYSHEDPDVVERRFETACATAAQLMFEGYVVFSPIAHSHPIEKYGMDQKYGWDFWSRQDFEFLKHAQKLIVLMLDGWETSTGVQSEIRQAQKHAVPIEYMEVGALV